MIPLAKNTIDNSDIDKLIDWLKTYPRLTKGPLTLQLEEKFSKWLGKKYSVFCNSGSSANLLMLSVLNEINSLGMGRVVVPSVSWATDLAPVIQLGFKPYLCDCNMEDLSVDLEHLEYIFKEKRPSALIFVSVLGLVPNMDKIVELCERHDVILLEDTCESMGCEYKGKKLGTFGEMSSFSTFFGHHISTIEGGFVSTDNKDLYELLVSLRSHGWDRDLDKETQLKLQKKWNVSEFNSLYTFYYPGYNLRSTDLNAFIGLGQIDKLDKICEKRNENFKIYQRELEKISPNIKERGFVSNFAYPVIHPNRDKIVKDLQDNDIEVRPMICGSMGTQPFYVKEWGRKELPNVTMVDLCGFYVPNHPKLTPDEIEFISNIINKGISE